MVIDNIQFQQVEALEMALGESMDFSTAANGFSPFYSDIGLGFNEKLGIESLYLYYNRIVTTIGSPFIEICENSIENKNTVLGVIQQFSEGKAKIGFYDRNSWMIECENIKEVKLNLETLGGMKQCRSKISDNGSTYIFESYITTKDGRDPDKYFPFILGVKVLDGELIKKESETSPLVIKSNSMGTMKIGFSVNVLDVNVEKIKKQLEKIPNSVQEAMEATKLWLSKSMGSIIIPMERELEAKIVARAVCTLLFNACKAPGNLGGRIASFPSRGNHPTHFLWDACFQNLAMEYMEPSLAEDALLILTENLRADGKMYHFISSTWARPDASQPPLVGWAALRLIEKRKDMNFAKKILPALCKNTEWWLEQRMTSYGIIFCPDPFETGWDDTPRLDKGDILPCDMNTYLLLQLQACVKIATFIGDLEIAKKYDKIAKEFTKRMVEVLYDSKENIFKDVLIETDEKIELKTPACFIPLLADLELTEEQIHSMIKNHLLDKEKFYGEIPFPSVAYNEIDYAHDKLWRGPVWIPIAYLLLEILKKYNCMEEYYEASEKLYNVILQNGDLREYFDSKTGEGMGSKQQSWTAAIFIKLVQELKYTNKSN